MNNLGNIDTIGNAWITMLKEIIKNGRGEENLLLRINYFLALRHFLNVFESMFILFIPFITRRS